MRYTQEKCRCMVWVDESLPRLHVCGRCFVCSLCVGCAYGELWHEYSTSTARAHELLLMDERTSKPLISHRHPQTFAGGDMHGGSCSYRYLKMRRYATTGIVELPCYLLPKTNFLRFKKGLCPIELSQIYL